MLQCVFPTRDANAPLVARFQSGKPPFRMWRDQVVSIKHGKIQKLARGLHTHRVLTDVFRPGAAVTVAIKSGHRIATTAFEFSSEDVCGHRTKLANDSLFHLKMPFRRANKMGSVGIVRSTAA